MKDGIEMLIAHPKMEIANPDCGGRVALVVVVKKNKKPEFWKRIRHQKRVSNAV
jgi:hypothetical protein